MPKLGIVFDIDELESASYGYAAYKIFFDAIDTRRIPGCLLSDGDTNDTLAGRANQYCIAVESFDESKIAAVKNILSTYNAKGLLPPQSRFLEDELVRSEPLVYSARINGAGELVDCQSHADWVMRAWNESRERHRGLGPTVAEPTAATYPTTERLIYVVLVSEKPIPKTGADFAGIVGLAFPEQLELVDAAKGEFRLRDRFEGLARTYKELVNPKYVDQLRSWLQDIGKGVHDLPRKHDIDVSEDTKRGHGLWPSIMSYWLEQIRPEFATSTAYRRKWSAIGSGYGKILAIGIYSTAPSEVTPPPKLEAPKLPETQAAKKYCIYCGFEMRVEGVFCPKCGKRQV